jgi:hypothetical protein
MPRRRLVSLFMGLAMAAAAVLALATPASADRGPFVMKPFGFELRMCLQPINESLFQGDAIVQMPCNGSRAQLWYEVPVGGDRLHYVNAHSQLCLNARGGATNGTPVQQWTCNSITNENWSIQPSDDHHDIPTLVSRVSGTNSHCLDRPSQGSEIGLPMQIYRCNGTLAQDFFL